MCVDKLDEVTNKRMRLTDGSCRRNQSDLVRSGRANTVGIPEGLLGGVESLVAEVGKAVA